MKRLLMHTFSKSIFGLVAITSTVSFAADNTDYYSNNLDKAIQAAQDNPIAENKLNSDQWLGKSTAQSINFTPMQNNEMEAELIADDFFSTPTADSSTPVPVLNTETLASSSKKIKWHENQKYLIDEQKNDQRSEQSKPKAEPVTVMYVPASSYESKTQYGHTEVYQVQGRTFSTSYYRD